MSFNTSSSTGNESGYDADCSSDCSSDCSTYDTSRSSTSSPIIPSVDYRVPVNHNYSLLNEVHVAINTSDIPLGIQSVSPTISPTISQDVLNDGIRPMYSPNNLDIYSDSDSDFISSRKRLRVRSPSPVWSDDKHPSDASNVADDPFAVYAACPRDSDEFEHLEFLQQQAKDQCDTPERLLNDL